VTVSMLSLHCLNAVCDDYEDLSSVLEDVRRSSHGNVSFEEIADSVSELVRDGLVESFEFDVSTGRYVRGSVKKTSPKEPGFSLRRKVAANWTQTGSIRDCASYRSLAGDARLAR
jgi:hypothetical protein